MMKVKKKTLQRAVCWGACDPHPEPQSLRAWPQQGSQPESAGGIFKPHVWLRDVFLAELLCLPYCSISLPIF